MKKVFSSYEISETVLVRDALLHRGIEAIVPSEHSGQSAVPEFRPPAEVWITRPDEYENARRVVTEALATLDSKSDYGSWACANCSEGNPGNFGSCWNCGAARNGSAG